MEFSQLRAFYEIARLGSFSRGAEVLCITQPALSRQVESLEKSVGVSLFDRHSRGVYLTEAGRRFYEYVEQMLRLAEEAERALKEIQGLETGKLSIGACTTVGNYVLPTPLAAFLKIHTGIEASLTLGSSEEIVEKALNRHFDLAFIASFANPPGLCIEPIHNDEILFLVYPGHPLCEVTEFRPELLTDEVFILREQGSATRTALEVILSKVGVKPSRIVTLGDTEAVKRAVMAGMGLTFLSRYTVSLELQHQLLIAPEIPELRLKRQFQSIYPKGTRLSPSALAFLSHLKKER